MSRKQNTSNNYPIMVKKTYFIPANYSLIILKYNWTYLKFFSNSLIIILKLPSNFKINKFLNCLSFYSNIIELDKFFFKILFNFSIISTSAIKFKGKAFRLTKYESYLDILFNYAHILWLVPRKIFVRRIQKYKFVFFHYNIFYLHFFSKLFTMKKPLGLYNKNGLRLFRQTVYKRKGKISQK